MGERNSPDAGETTLAAATAAIITARWASAPASPAHHSVPPAGNGHPGNGHSSHGHPGHAQPGNGYGGNGHAANGHHDDGGFTEWPAPISPVPPSGPPISPVPPSGPPISPSASPVSPGPYLQSQGSGLAAAASYFSPVAPDPVPEVFDARPRDTGLPVRDPGRDLGLAREEFRSQVPPGFERRTFGPAGESEPRGGMRADEAAVPSALLGVLPVSPPAAPAPPPPAPVSPAPLSRPMPASFAPPEPPPWTDTGWVDFPKDVESEPALTAGGAPLPRRTPRIPDEDYPLFDEDPAEPAPDPVAQRQELNRIADFLRDDGGPGTRPEEVDLEAVLSAIRAVPDVKDAQLRWNAQAGQTLRIEFADGVDESEVTRSVVRLLRAKLGLAAQSSAEESTMDNPYRSRSPLGRTGGRPTAPAAPAGGRPLPRPSGVDRPRLAVDNVTVTRLGAEATVEVRLRQPGGAMAVGEGRGPGVDAYLSRLAATAAGHAVDRALSARGAPRGKVFIEHVSVVPFGVVEVAVVVLLLSYDGLTEQLSGSAIVGDDPHVAVVRATLAALNRRLESLLA